MALSFGSGLGSSADAATKRQRTNRTENRKAFQTFIEDAVKNNQNLTAADLEREKIILSGGDSILSSQLGNTAVLKEIAKKHNEKVFNNTLTMATKNIKQSSEREKAYNDNIGVDDTYEQFKKKVLPTLGQTPELQNEAWNSLGWHDQNKFMQQQESKRLVAIDTIFNSDSFKATINSESDIDTIYGKEKSMSTWMVNGLKARFREGREKSIEDIVVSQTTTMLDKSFDSKQVADMISSYTSDGELTYNDEFISKMAEERLKALGITSPTTKQIARVANTIKSNLKTNVRSYKGQLFTDFQTEFNKDPYIAKYLTTGDYSSMSRGTFELALENTAKKFGWTEDDIFLIEQSTGNKILNPKVGGLIGFKTLDAMRRELTKTHIVKNTKEAKERANTYVKENITPEKSATNLSIYFNSANLDEDKDKEKIGLLQALTTKYFVSPNLGGAGAVLDQLIQEYDPEIHTNMGAYIDTIAAKVGLKSHVDTRDGVYKNLIDKKRFEGVEPDTPIEQYTNEYEIDIKKVETEVTDTIESLPSNYITEITPGNFVWNSKGVKAYTNVVKSAKQKLALMKADIISDFSHQNLHNFNEVMSSGKYERMIDGENVHLMSKEQFKNYLLGLVAEQEKFLDEQVDKIRPTGDVAGVGLYGKSADDRTGIQIADPGQMVIAIQKVHSASGGNRGSITALDRVDLKNPDPVHIIQPRGVEGMLEINPSYVGIDGFINLSRATGGPETNPFVQVFDLLDDNGKYSKSSAPDMQMLKEHAINILLVNPKLSGFGKVVYSRQLNNQGAKSGSAWNNLQTAHDRNQLFKPDSFWNTRNRLEATKGVVNFDLFFENMMYAAYQYRKQNPK